jgi:hypothetical protein
MSDKYSKSTILNDKFRGKKIMDKIRDKYRNYLGTSSADSRTSNQTDTKKGIADLLKNKSKIARNKAYNKMGMDFADKQKFETTFFSKGKLSKHETGVLKRKLERVKNRNRAMSKRQREEFAEVMGEDELSPGKAAQIKKFRESRENSKVKSTAADIGVKTRSKSHVGFAGGASKKSMDVNTANKLGKGISPGSGENLLKF